MTRHLSTCVAGAALLAVSALFVSGFAEATTMAGQLQEPAPATQESVSPSQKASDSAATPIAKREVEEQVELGRVRWGRDLEVAKKESATSGKPVIVLFQEVPG